MKQFQLLFLVTLSMVINAMEESQFSVPIVDDNLQDQILHTLNPLSGKALNNAVQRLSLINKQYNRVMHRPAIIQLIIKKRLQPITTRAKFDEVIKELSKDPAYAYEMQTSKSIITFIDRKNNMITIQEGLQRLRIHIDVINGKKGINTYDYFHNTPLSYVVRQASPKKNMALLKLLLENGANPNIKSNDGLSPLISLAATLYPEEKTSEIVRLLIEHGADVDITDNDDKTLLMNAANQGRLLVVETLLEFNANPLLTSNGQKASDFARKSYDVLKKENFDTTNYETILALLDKAEKKALKRHSAAL